MPSSSMPSSSMPSSSTPSSPYAVVAHAAVTTRAVRCAARGLLPERRLVESSAARVDGGRPCGDGAQRPALDGSARLRSQTVRARPSCRGPLDQRRSRRCRTDPLGQLRRRHRGEAVRAPTQHPRADAGERPRVAGAGMADPRGGGGFRRGRGARSRPTATGPPRCWRRSTGLARRRLRWRRFPRSIGRMAARSTWGVSPRHCVATALRC